MDHYQVLVPDVLTTAKFYRELGFRISNYLWVESAQRVVGTFLHRKDNPWDIVLLTRSGPRFHHGGYVVEAFEDIVRACDVAGNLGFGDRLEHGPSRHGHQHSYYPTSAIRTATAPNCCSLASRSSTSTTSR